MKAILKADRKIIVDMELYPYYADDMDVYIDKNSGDVYHEEELDWVEYQGG